MPQPAPVRRVLRVAILALIALTFSGLTVRPAHARQRPRPPIGAARPQQVLGEQRPDIPFTRPEPAVDPAAIRLWPMVAGTYWLTQGFGCVPQLGFYDLVPGCPAEAPAFHAGLDFGAPYGTLIYAGASGTVLSAGPDRAVGLANSLIVVQHEGPNAGFITLYMHWSVSYVVPGQYVTAGQPIAEVGSVGYSTGAHLHFGVLDASGANVDPLVWLPWDPGIGP